MVGYFSSTVAFFFFFSPPIFLERSLEHIYMKHGAQGMGYGLDSIAEDGFQAIGTVR